MLSSHRENNTIEESSGKNMTSIHRPKKQDSNKMKDKQLTTYQAKPIAPAY
jgi:hypothetical protein